jgi:hypothetical protein
MKVLFGALLSVVLLGAAHAADLVLTLDASGRVSITDGATVLTVDGGATALAHRLLGLELGVIGSAPATGSFVEIAPPPPPVVEPEPEPEPPPPPPPPAVVEPPSPVVVTSSITRSGITWSFASEVQSGTFANGDPWVLAGTEVASVSPGWDGSRGGSQVNPPYCSNGGPGTGRHGFDSTISKFDATKRTTFPRTLSAGDCLVSTWSWRAGESGAPAVVSGAPRPTARNAAVLTAVAAPPEEGWYTFRPAYSGSDRSVRRISRAELEARLEALPDWTAPPGIPSVAAVTSQMDDLWLDCLNTWKGRYLHPSANMEDYARDICADYGDGALMLLLDIPLASKVQIAVHLIQIGIDQYGILSQGPDWSYAGGGHVSGRRLPTVLAGYLLGDAAMREFFLAHTDIRLTGESVQVHRDSQGVYWRDEIDKNRANPGSIGYRTQTSNVWIAGILVTRALDLMDEYALPDGYIYQDGYMDESFSDAWKRAWHGWHGDLWDDTDGGRHAP